MRASKASRRYRLAPDLKKYQVRTLETGTKYEKDLRGTYYLVSDLVVLPTRNFRRETAERNARAERLIAQYGASLPAAFEKYSDEDLTLYFESSG
jgi:hypothetical protein